MSDTITKSFLVSILYALVFVLAGEVKARDFRLRAREIVSDEEQLIGTSASVSGTVEDDGDDESVISYDPPARSYRRREAFRKWRQLTLALGGTPVATKQASINLGKNKIHRFMDKYAAGNGSAKKAENLIDSLVGEWEVLGSGGSELTAKKKWNYAELAILEMERTESEDALHYMLQTLNLSP